MPRRGELKAHQPKKQSSMTPCTDCPATRLTIELDQKLGATSAIKTNELNYILRVFANTGTPVFDYHVSVCSNTESLMAQYN